MHRISEFSDIAGQGDGPVRTGRPGVAYPEVEDGMPVDRTICPRCFGIEGEAHVCPVCRGAPVCPGCRNARLVSRPGGQSVNYDVCPACCDRLEDVNGVTERFAGSGAPRWVWLPGRQRAAIEAYRARARARYRASVPAGDPWDEVAS